MHACEDGSHTCFPGDGGVCFQAGAGYSCGCLPGFECTAGCDGGEGHTCTPSTGSTPLPDQQSPRRGLVPPWYSCSMLWTSCGLRSVPVLKRVCERVFRAVLARSGAGRFCGAAFRQCKATMQSLAWEQCSDEGACLVTVHDV